MSKKVIVHIGTPKTGSTSIQRFLLENEKFLSENGAQYFSELHHNNIEVQPLFRNNPHKGMRWKQSHHMEESESVRKRKLAILEQLISNTNEDTVIFSSEVFFRYEEEEVIRFTTFLKNHFDEIKIVAYLREPQKFFPSYVQQIVKNGLHPLSAEELLDNAIQAIQYEKNLRIWEKVVSTENLIVRPFDRKAFKKGNLCYDFFSCIFNNLPEVTFFEQAQHSNVSIGVLSLAVLEQYNRKYPGLVNGEINSERGLCLHHIPDIVFQNTYPEQDKMSIDFSASQAEKINKQLPYINDLLPEGFAFEPVEGVGYANNIPRIEDVPPDYFIEMMNQYHKHIEHLVDNQKRLRTEVEVARKKLPSKLLSHYQQRSKRIVPRLISLLRYIPRRVLIGFDEDFYEMTYPDVRSYRWGPRIHYLWYGASELRSPCEGFDIYEALMNNPSIINSGRNPLAM